MYKGPHMSVFTPSLDFKGTPPKVSFELFPPKNEALEATLWKSVDRLKSLNPAFFSVTYGADGSTRDKTHEVIERLIKETNIPAVPHLTCVDAPKAEIDDIADRYWDIGVRSIVALRGDPASGAGTQYQPHPDGYDYAVDLIESLKKRHDFQIGCAAYPETHPEAPSAHFDVDNLKRKFDAGADFAISQFFFDPEHFLRFRDRCVHQGIDGRLIPGILPVSNYQTLKRFTTACGTEVPSWLDRAFEGLDDDPATRQLIASGVAIEQVSRLRNEGIDEFHFYSLNRSELCYAVSHALGLRSNSN